MTGSARGHRHWKNLGSISFAKASSRSPHLDASQATHTPDFVALAQVLRIEVDTRHIKWVGKWLSSHNTMHLPTESRNRLICTAVPPSLNYWELARVDTHSVHLRVFTEFLKSAHVFNQIICCNTSVLGSALTDDAREKKVQIWKDIQGYFFFTRAFLELHHSPHNLWILIICLMYSILCSKAPFQRCLFLFFSLWLVRDSRAGVPLSSNKYGLHKVTYYITVRKWAT